MRARAFRFASISFLFAAAVACGSRTGLFLDEDAFGPNPIDGGDNPNIDGGRRDARIDRDEIEDAPPPLDVTPPIDVNRIDCAEAGTTYIYVISNSYQLYSFDPATNATKFIGNIACPASSNADTPFSMAVDRKGVAYILFTDERLYRVSTLNAACLSTSYVPRQSNFGVFGMGFATSDEPGGPVEHLYVAGDRRNNSASGLARIDVTNFKLTPVGDPDIEHAELTGTGGGAMYAFYKRSTTSPPSFIGELDTTTGQVKGEKKLDTIDQGQGWAFAFWGGDFYMFHAPNGNSLVTRYRPSDDSVTQVATLPSIIVGAGVSTCAPQQ